MCIKIKGLRRRDRRGVREWYKLNVKYMYFTFLNGSYRASTMKNKIDSLQIAIVNCEMLVSLSFICHCSTHIHQPILLMSFGVAYHLNYSAQFRRKKLETFTHDDGCTLIRNSNGSESFDKRVVSQVQ